MLDRKGKVYSVIRKLSEEIDTVSYQENKIGFDAETISTHAGLDRSNVSRELNKLAKEDKVLKFKGRPVYYIEKEAFHRLSNQVVKGEVQENVDPFDCLIGANYSLAAAIEKAKAAICYPPSGIHTILIGSTGVGKTLFAETMYEYAKIMHRIPEEGKLISFNCAEYAENSQLLLSQLFGHVKGAFTGAETETNGLVEQANNGILLLDEIHRLSREGQEMLFQLIDKGEYRKLGETDNVRKVKVLIICATTENINKSLLRTFLRRIPSIIELPSLKNKKMFERIQLAEYFFTCQSKIINVPLKLTKEVFFSTILYDCIGNIGQLKSDIQLLCSKGFLDYKLNQKELITITSDQMPDYMYEGLLQFSQKRNEIQNLMGTLPDYYMIHAKEDLETFNLQNSNVSVDVFDSVINNYQFFEQRGLPAEEIAQLINNNIEEYVEMLLTKYNLESNYNNEKEILKIVSIEVYKSVEGALIFAEHKLKRKINKKARIGLIIHVSALIEKLERNEYKVEEFNRSRLPSCSPKELSVAKLIRRLLESELAIKIPEEEIHFFAIFLRDSSIQQKTRNVGVLVITHGNSTARSMAEVANTMLSTNHCHSIDMELSDDPKEVLSQAVEKVKEINEGEGVLLMVDMGSLTSFSSIIERRTGIPVLGIDCVTTPTVLEAVRKSISGENSLSSLYNDLKKETPFMGEAVGKSERRVAKERKIILTTCLTGKGAALKIAGFVEKNLAEESLKQVEIISVERLTRANFAEVLAEKGIDKERLAAIVGSIGDDFNHLPIISIDELVAGKGIEKLEKIIEGVPVRKLPIQADLTHKVYYQTMASFFEFLDVQKVCEYIEQSFLYIKENTTLKEQESQLKIRYIIHCGCMIERLIKGEVLPYKEVDQLIGQNSKLAQIINESFIRVNEVYGIDLPDTELAYLIELLNTD